MARITETVEVALPAATVFTYLANFDHTAEWDPGIARSERIDSGELGVGARFRLDANLGVTTRPLVYEIVRFEAPTRVTLQTESRLVSGEDDIRIEALGPERCSVTWDARFGFRGPIGRALDPLLRPGFDAVGRRAIAGLEAKLGELAATR